MSRVRGVSGVREVKSFVGKLVGCCSHDRETLRSALVDRPKRITSLGQTIMLQIQVESSRIVGKNFPFDLRTERPSIASNREIALSSHA